MWVHLRPEDRHDLGFDLRVGEEFYPVREIALQDGSGGDEPSTIRLGSSGGRTYRNGYEENARAREEVWMIKALPYRIPPTFSVRIKRHLDYRLSTNFQCIRSPRDISLGCQTRTSGETGGRSWCKYPARTILVGQLISAVNMHYPP